MLITVYFLPRLGLAQKITRDEPDCMLLREAFKLNISVWVWKARSGVVSILSGVHDFNANSPVEFITR